MRCTFLDKWSISQQTGPSCSVSRSSPAVEGLRKCASCHRAHHRASAAWANCSCFRSCESRSCSTCTSQSVKKLSMDARAARFTKSAKWHRLRQRSLASVAACTWPGNRQCCGGTLPPKDGTTAPRHQSLVRDGCLPVFQEYG